MTNVGLLGSSQNVQLRTPFAAFGEGFRSLLGLFNAYPRLEYEVGLFYDWSGVPPLMVFTSRSVLDVVSPEITLKTFTCPYLTVICDFLPVTATSGFACSGAAKVGTTKHAMKSLSLIASELNCNLLFCGRNTGVISTDATPTPSLRTENSQRSLVDYRYRPQEDIFVLQIQLVI